MRPLPTLGLLAALCVLTTGTGCATLFTGTSDNISFDSDPQGAEILIDGLVVGRTPTTVSVKRPGLSDQQVTMRLDGYDPVTFTLSDEFNAISILNLAGLLGWGVDIVTGAITKYDKQFYNADMDRGSVAVRLGDLERTGEGAYVLPDAAGSVAVIDEASGLQFVFGQRAE